MIDSLSSISAVDITKKLPESAFINLLTLQKSLTIDIAATAPTLTQVMLVHGEPTLTKLICAILKLFNDGLNTTEQMSARQLFEYAIIWCSEFPNETVKDLILCLKRVKAGRYGKIFNRVDGSVISDFFRQYLLEKADWGEQQNRQFISEQVKAGNHVMASLTDEQRDRVKTLIKRPVAKLDPDEPFVASDRSYTNWLKQHAEEVEFEVLEDVRKRACHQDHQEVLSIVDAELDRRNQLNQEQTV